MRGWFDLVSAARAEHEPPTCRAFAKKRLKGFEPSTFCMAIRPGSRRRTPRMWRLAGTSHWRGGRRRSQIRVDMRRYAAFRALVRVSARNPRWRFDSAFSDWSSPRGDAGSRMPSPGSSEKGDGRRDGHAHRRSSAPSRVASRTEASISTLRIETLSTLSPNGAPSLRQNAIRSRAVATACS